MADRSIVVRLRAEVDGFKREFDAATKAVEQTAKGTETAAKQADTAMGRMVQSAKTNREAWNTTGTALAGFGAASLGALTLSTKAAMDWESAWAGVVKTVDGTAPQMAALQSGLRGLARELPATHTEIAAVAEAAGQLGIAIPNILSFTRTMINMGEATNLTAEEAATSLARFVNITGTSQNKIGLLGASIVGLGNNFATTEAEILGMSMRLAGAGAQASLSEGDILGIATAMSSVGIEAEAGGSAMSQTMKRIGKAVDEGGDALDLFAQVSGMSAQQFSDAWRNDPTTALDAFINGLSGVEAQGMTTNGVLAELGITGIREADSLLRLSAASEQGANGMSLLADAVATGNAEFDKGTALIEEASKRYETTESRVAMARNALVDSAISIGSIVLPAVAGLADGVADLAGGFADLPGPAQASLTVLGGIGGAAALGAGSFLLLFPRVMDTVGAFRDMGMLSDSMAGKLGRATVTVGKAGLAFAALSAVPPVLNAITDAIRGIDNAKLDLGMSELTAGLLKGEQTGKMFDAVLGDMYASGALNKKMFSDLGSTVTKVADINWFENMIGPLAATGINDAKDRLLELSDAFVLLSQTDLAKAQSTFSAFMNEAAASGATFEQVLDVMPTFRDELTGLATQMGLDGTDSAVLYKIAMGELTPVVDDATGAVAGYTEGVDAAADATTDAATAADELYEKMTSLAEGFINAERSAMDYADALEEANKAAEENGKHWEDGTEAADKNKDAFLDLADAALANADAMRNNGEATGQYLSDTREELIGVLTQMTGNREEAEAYVDALGLTPEYISTQIELETDAALAKWDEIFAEIWPEGGHPPMVIDPEVDPDGKVPAFTGVLDTIPPEVDTTVDADTTQGESNVRGFVDVINGTGGTVVVDAQTYWAEDALRAFQISVNEAGGTVTINGDTMYADAALDTLVAEINAGNGTVTIDGEDVPAQEALRLLTARINESGGTVTIDGDNSPANAATSAAKRKADGTTGTIDVDADTSGANSSINNAARDRTSTIRVKVAYDGSINGQQYGMGYHPGRAAGGPIRGIGTGTSDSVPFMGSNGEHVLTAAEVALAGGHDSVFRMRAAIRAGMLRFREGGGIENGQAVRMTPVPAYRATPASSSPGSTPSVSVSQTISGLNAYEVARESRAEMQHVLRSQIPTFAR